MEYTEFTVVQQRQLLKSRIAGWEADHFGHEINLMAGQTVRDQSTIDASETALRVLEDSVNAAKEMLTTLEATPDDSATPANN